MSTTAGDNTLRLKFLRFHTKATSSYVKESTTMWLPQLPTGPSLVGRRYEDWILKIEQLALLECKHLSTPYAGPNFKFYDAQSGAYLKQISVPDRYHWSGYKFRFDRDVLIQECRQSFKVHDLNDINSHLEIPSTPIIFNKYTPC